MQILALTLSDIDSLPEIQPSDWTDIRIPISSYLEFDCIFPFKVMIENILVGTGTAILHEKTGWLARYHCYTQRISKPRHWQMYYRTSFSVFAKPQLRLYLPDCHGFGRTCV